METQEYVLKILTFVGKWLIGQMGFNRTGENYPKTSAQIPNNKNKELLIKQSVFVQVSYGKVANFRTAILIIHSTPIHNRKNKRMGNKETSSRVQIQKKTKHKLWIKQKGKREIAKKKRRVPVKTMRLGFSARIIR